MIKHDSQIVRDKENIMLNHAWPSQRQASGANPSIKAICQCRRRVQGLTIGRAIKKIALNHDWVYNQACIQLRDVHVISYLFMTFNHRH